MKLRKGDVVQVISGNENGKQGRIIKVFPGKNRIIVENLNVVKKHIRPSQDNPQGGIIEKESAIHISNVMLVVNDKPSKIGYKILEDGKKVRMAKINKEIINN